MLLKYAMSKEKRRRGREEKRSGGDGCGGSRRENSESNNLWLLKSTAVLVPTYDVHAMHTKKFAGMACLDLLAGRSF